MYLFLRYGGTINTNSSMSALRKAPVMSYVATNCSSAASIAAVISSASVDTVGDGASSSAVYNLWQLPLTHVRHLILPSFFS